MLACFVKSTSTILLNENIVQTKATFAKKIQLLLNELLVMSTVSYICIIVSLWDHYTV